MYPPLFSPWRLQRVAWKGAFMDGYPRKSYPTDLTDEQWALVEAILLGL